MTSSSDLTTDLRALPHPTPPPDMTGVVMARIAEFDEPKTADTNALRSTSIGRRIDWSGWMSVGGLVAGLVIAVLNYPAPTGITSLGHSGAMAGIADVSSAPLATLSLVTGFAIYLASLFLPVRERR